MNFFRKKRSKKGYRKR